MWDGKKLSVHTSSDFWILGEDPSLKKKSKNEEQENFLVFDILRSLPRYQV